MAAGRRSRDAAEEIPPEVRGEILREFKTRHFAAWPDQSIPALDGKTPREAAKTREGRRKLDVLLKDAEHLEQSLDPAERFDFSDLRKELGLDV